jgi:phage tail P2-like protein
MAVQMANLLPPNATALERNVAATTAGIGALPVPLVDLVNPNKCPVHLLPWLAAYLSVDSWDITWTEAQKRETIRASLGVHRTKGTIGAVRRALAALGYQAQLQEWFNQIPAAAPFTFRLLLTADQVGFGQADLGHLQNVVNATKNVRSHLSEIVPQIVSTTQLTAGAAASVGTEITITGFGYSLVADGSVNGDGQYRASGIKVKMN